MGLHGYILCKGDTRDYCFVDPAGKVHSLGRRVADLKARELREFMTGLDRDSLPTIEEAKKRAEPWGDSDAARAVQSHARFRKSLAAAERTREKRQRTKAAPTTRGGVCWKRNVEHEQKERGEPEPKKGGGDWQERVSDKKDREPER